MEELRCCYCGTVLTKDTAVLLTSTNKKTEVPRCKDCYERSVRQFQKFDLGKVVRLF